MWLGLGGKSGKVRTRKRKAERYSSDLLSCPLGSIVDLSGTGLRLRCEGKPTLSIGQILAVPLQSPQSRLTLRCRVVWVRKKGFRTKFFDVGMEFVDVTPQIAKALESMALFGFVPRMEGARTTTAPPPLKPDQKLPDYYAILGLTAGATTQEIHDAYRALARQYHPDANKAPYAVDRFEQVSAAYRVLRDPELREGYDLQRSALT